MTLLSGLYPCANPMICSGGTWPRALPQPIRPSANTASNVAVLSLQAVRRRELSPAGTDCSNEVDPIFVIMSLLLLGSGREFRIPAPPDSTSDPVQSRDTSIKVGSRLAQTTV